MKHHKSINDNGKNANLCSLFVCQTCNKTYKDNSGLWRHKKKCAKEELDNDYEKEEKIIKNISKQVFIDK